MNQRAMSAVRARRDSLRGRYKAVPAEARITDRARTVGGVETDPFHGSVVPGSEDHGVDWAFGMHRSVGGNHDAPNPGDMLCAALAACLYSTLRIIADRLGVGLTRLQVDVTAEADVRGTLAVERSVPVGFTAVRCHVDIGSAPGTDSGLVRKLLAAAENSCVNLQTLRNGVAIETSLAQS